ncbi:hypothetical protein V8J36_05245 [Frigidibacter sp. MR17.14]|uniref:hypothetical protein n=1 Tax=Frigidibacter sp. MR17.14 TaxID=3126509 RepID=UPI003012F36C
MEFEDAIETAPSPETKLADRPATTEGPPSRWQQKRDAIELRLQIIEAYDEARSWQAALVKQRTREMD